MLRFALALSLFCTTGYSQITAVDATGGIYTGAGDRSSISKSTGESELWRTELGPQQKALVLMPVSDGSLWAGGAAGQRGFLAHLDSNGAVVSEIEVETPVRALAIDPAGSVYLARDGFLEKLDRDRKPVYSIAVKEAITAIAVDSTGSLFAAIGASVGKLNAEGSEWLWHMDLGPSSPSAIAVDPTGPVYVTGITQSLDFPVVAAAQPKLDGPSDAFVAKIKADGSSFEWSTYLGGRGVDAGTAIALDQAGNLWVAGYTTSSDFPGSSTSIGSWHGAEDGFLARLDSRGAVVESQYFGSPGNDRIQSLAIDAGGNPHVGGWNDEGSKRSFNAKAAAIVKAAAICDPLVVTSLADSVTSPVCGMLRFAVGNAPLGATITFGVTGTILLDTSAILDPNRNSFVHNNHIMIGRDLNIQGPGASQLTIDGGGNTRLFFIQNGSVTIRGVTLAHGLGKGGDSCSGGGGAGMGGAIFQNGGTLSLTGVVLSANRALGGSSDVFILTACPLGGGGFGGDGATTTPIGGPGGDLGGRPAPFLPGMPAGNSGAGAGGSAFLGAGGIGGGGAFSLPSEIGGFGGFGGGAGGFGLLPGFGGGPSAKEFGGGGAGFGGAIFVLRGILNMTDTSFNTNAAVGGGAHFQEIRGEGRGGALFVVPQFAVASATRVTFLGSIAAEAGTDSQFIVKRCPGFDTVEICGNITGTFSTGRTVTDAGDAGPGTLREALAAPGSPIIAFTMPGTVIKLRSRLLIANGATIQGPGADKLLIDGGGATRLFFIQGGTVVMSGLTLANGLGLGGNSGGGGGAAGMGGAIFQNSGSLTLTGVTLSGNKGAGGNSGPSSTLGSGGGGFGGDQVIAVNGGSGAGGGDLGGVGGTTSANASLGGNGGDGAGGAAGVNRGGNGGFGGGGGLSVSNASVPGAGGFGGGGGGNSSGSTLGVPGFGGGRDRSGGGGAGFGGAIFVRTGNLSMTDTVFTNNLAVGGGLGASAGQGKGGALFVMQGATATAVRVTFTGSIAPDAALDSFTGYDGTTFGARQCPGRDTVDFCGNLTGSFTPSPTVQVLNLNDSGPGSLRNTIPAAGPGTTLVFSVKGTIPLRSRILITKDITIQGPSAAQLTIDGGGVTRLFFIQSGNVFISAVTLSNGLAKGGSASGGGAGAGMGGAIFQNGGTLTVTNVAFSNNKALGGDQVPGNALGGGGFGVNAPVNGNGADGGDLGGRGGQVNSNGIGGNGGDGAGGATGFNQPGNGGFAGGGGGFGGSGGKGGFGGGGGFGGADIGGGPGGFGGGSNGAGGGAGFGGAIFLRAGTLSLTNVSLFNNTAAGGSGNFGGTRGQGKGGALFLMPGATATTFNIAFFGNVAAQAGVNSPTGYDGTATGAKLCPGKDTVDICGVLPVNLAATGTLARDSDGALLVTVTVANAGGTAADDVMLTGVSINGVGGKGLPVALGTIAASQSATVTVRVPGVPAASGAAGVLSLGGYYSGGSFNGGSFNYASRVTLP